MPTACRTGLYLRVRNLGVHIFSVRTGDGIYIPRKHTDGNKYDGRRTVCRHNGFAHAAHPLRTGDRSCDKSTRSRTGDKKTRADTANYRSKQRNDLRKAIDGLIKRGLEH